MATQLETLTAISDAMKVEPFYLFLTSPAVKSLVKKGFVEQNESIEDSKCQFATRLTNAGLSEINSTQAVAPIVKVPTMTDFIIKTAELPATTRKAGAGRSCKYPFGALQVGQYFFVPDSEKQPEPVKSLGSVVNSANQKYAKATGEMRTNRKGREVPVVELTRKFAVRPYHETDAAGDIVNGAGVWRVQ